MIVAGVINDGAPPKRKRKSYDQNRARLCIQSNYLGSNSTFCDDFYRIFRITHSIYDRIKSLCMREDSFFRDGADCCGAVSHSVDAKLLIALKYLAYRVSVNCFHDYFQMGKTTALLFLFVRCLIRIDELRDKYLRTMIPTDAKRVEKLHKKTTWCEWNGGSIGLHAHPMEKLSIGVAWFLRW